MCQLSRKQNATPIEEIFASHVFDKIQYPEYIVDFIIKRQTQFNNE